MKFNVTVGNPPYNKDLYILFVELGKNIAEDCSIFITPAKWQSKGGELNERFREEIVPYISKVVYYPSCYDVFFTDLSKNEYPKISSGVSYFLVDSNKHQEKDMVEICKINKSLNFTWKSVGERLNSLFDPRVISIVKKVSSLKEDTFRLDGGYGEEGGINVSICGMYSWGGFLNSDGQTYSLQIPYIWNESKENTMQSSVLVRTCSSKLEAESIISYINTRLVRFLTWISCTTQSMNNENSWRFVPDEKEYNHIFTDEELYKKYKLSDEEIELINSLIKVRNQKQQCISK